MASYHNIRLRRFGLLDESVSPATRVFSADPTTAASASVRQVLEQTTDPEGQTYFSGFESSLTMSSADVDDLGQGEAYMTARKGVKLVGIVGDFAVQVHTDTLVQATEEADVTTPALTSADYVMNRQGGGRGTHGIIISRNLLTYLQEEGGSGGLAGGWADTDSNNTPDGYTETNLTGGTFSGGTYSANVDTANGSDGSLNVQIPFPLDGQEVTLSVDVNTLHDDGTNEVRIEAIASDKTTVQTSAATTVSSTGRTSVTLTTPEDGGSGPTYYLKLYPIRVTGASAENTKFDIQDPALRVDGGTSYVKK